MVVVVVAYDGVDAGVEYDAVIGVGMYDEVVDGVGI